MRLSPSETGASLLATVQRCKIQSVNKKMIKHTHTHVKKKIQNLPNIIQSDPDTKTKASMFFSLSQRSRHRRGSDCSINCSKSPTIWQIKEGGDNISQADRSGGAGAGDGGGQQVFSARRLEKQTPGDLLKHPSPLTFPPPPARIPPSPSSTAAQWLTVLLGFKGFGRGARCNKSQR